MPYEKNEDAWNAVKEKYAKDDNGAWKRKKGCPAAFSPVTGRKRL